ncbi:MAG: hypothetical protein ACRCST_03695 [Turicibacter sp.]
MEYLKYSEFQMGVNQKVSIKEKDIYTAKLLSQDYAGTTSSLTKILQYLYSSLKLNSECKEVSEVLFQFAYCEMNHLRILGDLIESLGGDVKFEAWYADIAHVWSSKDIRYESDIASILNQNIKLEIDSIKMLTRHIEMIDNKPVIQVLQQIVSNEEKQLIRLSDLFKSYVMTTGHE